MPTWPAFTIAAVVLAQQPAEPSCSPQEGAEWPEDPRHVAALTCSGRRGFFVPSAEFRAMRKNEEAYDLLEQELRLAKFEIGALRQTITAGEEEARLWKELAAHHRSNWMRAEEDVQEIAADAQEAGRRAWHESPALWVIVGVVATSLVVWAASKLRSDPVVLSGP